MKSANEQAESPKKKLLLEIPAPALRYKLGFLIGGMAFAVISYLAGTLLYEMELALADGTVLSWGRLSQTLADVYHKHLLTFTPWVIGTTGVSIVLGYLFDKQVQYRRAAERVAATNGLTLLATRRYFMQGIAREFARAERGLSNLFSVLMIDVDEFKKYNDSYGHMAGDKALQNVSYIVRSSLRVADTAGRFGGEEIVVFLAGAGKDRAAEGAGRLRGRIEAESDVTVSVGVASFPRDGQNVDELIRAADEAMYRAKQTGKNKVCLAGKDG